MFNCLYGPGSAVPEFQCMWTSVSPGFSRSSSFHDFIRQVGPGAVGRSPGAWSVPTTSARSQATFRMRGVEAMRRSANGVYELCWCRPSNDTLNGSSSRSCKGEEDFTVVAGTLSFLGPNPMPTMQVRGMGVGCAWACRVGGACFFQAAMCV